MNLNRIFINIKCQSDCMLDYNYQYDLLKTLYGAYTAQNEANSKLFHEVGFIMEHKKFKLINTCLIFENSEMVKEGIKLKEGEEIKIMISGVEHVINEIVKGFIKINKFSIRDCKFEVKGLTNDKKINFKRVVLNKVLTIVVESKFTDGKIEYLSVYDKRFYETLAQNLKRKYKLIYDEEFKDELYFDIENVLSAKKKKINGIKKDGYLKGYGNFNIWIQTNIKMQKVAYYCGIGQNNMLGAGALLHLTSR
ncbi:CRISPR-associated endoribonuclease Cas6 [Clostridium estertheticum]|uniref:CRISPR-associated endoribonuclease Cas6 n=1 Tax=Clostridium estertheticum TaxID=238834 RepID=UPI001C0C5C3D|nr:CRISPR-associated endoribonuclease Cas6 [Clostridium estertheticum]MBU3174306.1 CRISPR-associated endoribonuclease Cas6 [Clostridium estertheticum]